ncbi:RNase A-like domain-containing protein [Pseudomonas sp. efr-133-TYG-103a]|uniref:RNase A-like domain-containing protein n=1 Tax=Pseudomonas sp. efr-133-TYG-103a TaxID=3040308 RepID=UPI002555154D|nr:RNase A-like domain-containing protein [Pseudomonas sp. efr-133-TYG-103a]
MPDQDEFRVTLSLAQMAAILENESLTPYEIFSSRVVGSLRLVGGIIELGGAGVLCAVPEPTMITKVGCVAMGLHAADQMAAGAHQLVTARETDSYAFKAGMTAAEVMGASRASGQVVGLAAEFAVPLSTASLYNAFRVSSVRAGRMTVVVSERFPNAPRKGPGGHVIRDHIGKELVAVQTRLKKTRGTDAISVFTNLDVAEWAVSQVLRSNKNKISINSKMSLYRKNKRLSMRMDLGTTVGWGVARVAPDTPIYMHKVVVVIEFSEYNHMPAYIVTAYPVL